MTNEKQTIETAQSETERIEKIQYEIMDVIKIAHLPGYNTEIKKCDYGQYLDVIITTKNECVLLSELTFIANLLEIRKIKLIWNDVRKTRRQYIIKGFVSL